MNGGRHEIRIRSINGLPEITESFDLGSAVASGIGLRAGDIVVISQKAVSKSEGRLVRLETVEPGSRATGMAERLGKDPRIVELILAESQAVIREDADRGILITETRHGLICANAGVDSSNLPEPDTALLLPEDPDASARRVRRQIESAGGQRPAVIITDSLGRAWRLGQAEVAIGCAGIEPLADWRGRRDCGGRELAATVIATADQVAAAADLARNKTSRTPVVVVTGLPDLVTEADGPGSATQIRPAAEDLFR
jgi:coenzyme F420-0:L-glutamate ligase/coenzyme F420-1:gamma-L-glutamate ligase